MRTGLLGRLAAIGLLMLAPTGVYGMSAAHAATLPTAVQQMAVAMAAVHSYKMSMVIVAHDTAKGTTSHVTGIVIRKGKSETFYMKMQIAAGPGATMNIEVISDGKRSCIKGFLGPSWTCSKNSATSGASNSLTSDITKLTTSYNSFSFTSLGEKTVQGELCDGFTVGGVLSSQTAKGSMWISAARHLLIEVDLKSKAPLATGGKPVEQDLTIVMSHYNDPSLSIPKV